MSEEYLPDSVFGCHTEIKMLHYEIDRLEKLLVAQTNANIDLVGQLDAITKFSKELKAAIWPINSAVLGDSSNWIYESPKFNPAHKIVIQITIGEAREIRNAMNNIKS